MDIEAYILAHTDKEDEYLHRLWRAAHFETVHGHMVSGHLQGQLLKAMVEMVRPKRVLEVGTFVGYSAICMAKGLPEGGHLWTYEVNDELEDFARRWIDGADVGDKITFAIGDANVEAPKLGLEFDMMFIDGDKREYVKTYDTLFPFLRKGGFMLADNTLWDGHVTDPSYDNDPQTLGIRAFNEHIMADERVEKTLLPLRDGLTIIHKK